MYDIVRHKNLRLMLWFSNNKSNTAEKRRPTMLQTATVRPRRSGPRILYNTPLIQPYCILLSVHLWWIVFNTKGQKWNVVHQCTIESSYMCTTTLSYMGMKTLLYTDVRSYTSVQHSPCAPQYTNMLLNEERYHVWGHYVITHGNFFVSIGWSLNHVYNVNRGHYCNLNSSNAI